VSPDHRLSRLRSTNALTCRTARFRCNARSGNLILFGKYAGQEIKVDGEEYLIMKEDDVLAVIEGKTKKKTR